MACLAGSVRKAYLLLGVMSSDPTWGIEITEMSKQKLKKIILKKQITVVIFVFTFSWVWPATVNTVFIKQ